MPDQLLSLEFPVAGIDRLNAFGAQQPRQMPNGETGRTTYSGVNVRGYEPGTQRARGGSRPGLSKYVADAVVSGWIVQELNNLTWMGGVATQASQSGRIVTLVAVSQGNVYYTQAGGSTWSLATNNTGLTPPLNFSGILYSTSLNQKLWFADGINWCYFDPSTTSVNRWQATQGSLPADSRGNTPRLIATWRGRIVLSGLLYDPQNWFMSAVGDPTNFDYAPADITPTQAVAGNNSPVGIVGDVINSLCPYSDDTMIMFGDHTIWQLSGDPMEGGRIDRISDTVGAAWGIPWAKDPFGTIYFVSNQMGIYTLVPGQQPQRISQPIEQLVQVYNSGSNTIRVLWNDKFQGAHFFFSPTVAPGTTTHLFYEARTGAWWQDQFASTNYDPLCCTIFDGNLNADRTALIGSWDGYVRSIDKDATTDDGSSISSSIFIGPINSPSSDMITLKALQALLGTGSGNVTYTVYTGPTAEAALASTAVQTGTWTSARNLSNLLRRSGHAIYVKLSSTSAWSMEQIVATIEGRGIPFRRGR